MPLSPESRWLLQDLDKQIVAEHGASGSAAFDDAGPPNWSEAAWNAFRAQYGRDPFSAQELPPHLETAPEWVFRRLGLRPPLMNGHRPTFQR
jgi:hypothetical protein